MAQYTEVKMRVDFLRQFDTYIRNEIGDDSITESWLMCGVPDGSDEVDLLEIAKDDELWLDCVNCFARCCKRAKVI